MTKPLPLTVAIATFQREAMLLATLECLLGLRPSAAEILVVDQTREHDPETESKLGEWAAAGQIDWIRLPEPSITAAMNEALRRAGQDLVLFVDDDIRPEPRLLAAHVEAHARHPDGLVAGRVIQPWQEGTRDAKERGAGFESLRRSDVREFIGCNFSIRRQLALDMGGFDENFVRVAYRYEAEFAHRYRSRGLAILFEPDACLHHLKDAAGGTRSFGDHLTTWRPDHAVGAYYCALRTRSFGEFAIRPWRAIATRYHLRHPWRIPGTLIAELAGMTWAVRLFMHGPRYLSRAPAKQ